MTTSKLQLPNVTLVLLSGLGYRQKANVHALEYSQKGIEFGEILYLQLGHIKDIDSWSKAAIYDLAKHITTEFCLLVHENGFVVNPEQWNPDWLNYDFIGSPWPLPEDNYSYRTPKGEIIRVGNSVSLRSKKLLDLATKQPMEYHYGNNNEDGQICVWSREALIEGGCKFAPLLVAKHFGRELDMPENLDVSKPFVFHYNRFKPGRNQEYYDLISQDI